jgi:uncharacterized protein (DUF58 family)
MSLTARGMRFLGAMVVLLSLGVIFLDFIILVAFFAALAALAYDALDAMEASRMSGDSVKLNPDGFRATILRGDSTAFRTSLTNKRRVALDISGARWIEVETLNFEPGTRPVTLRVSPRLTGQYSTERVTALVSSRFGFFSTSVMPKLAIEVNVYPRFLVAALAVVELLIRSGAGHSGEQETELLGPGFEYADTRPYQPGDSLRRIDWKATARFSSLMVKQYYRESGGSLNLIYLLDTPGPRTHDEMATQFLNLLVSASSSGTPVSVIAYAGEDLLAKFTGRGREVLVPALSLVLNKSELSVEDMYSLLDIVPVSQERRILLLTGKAKLAELLKHARAVGPRQNRDSARLIAEISTTEPSPSSIILSSLVSRNHLLPEIIDHLTSIGHAAIIAYPREPWTDTRDLEEAYLMSLTHEKLSKFVDSRGCVLISLPVSGSSLAIPWQMPARIINS